MSLIKNTVRRLYRAFLPAGARNALRMHLVFEAADRKPKLVEDFAASCVLVLAPHMDDEVVGCGGTLLKHLQSGALVKVLYLTDGRKGNPALYAQQIPERKLKELEESVAVTRKAEAQAAAKVIGIEHLIFFDEPDAGLRPTPQVVARLERMLLEERPDVIYVPSPLDSHCDHWATNLILHAALERVSRSAQWPVLIRGYEVWTPLPVNRLVNISDCIETKMDCLGKFASQTRHINYVRVISSLNAYRSMYFQKGEGYAEAYLETTPKEYSTLVRAYLEEDESTLRSRSRLQLPS